MTHPTQFGLSIHNGIKMAGRLDQRLYGSLLTHKKFDCNNGFFSANVFFQSMG